MKTILVTGGNRGIGLEICRQLDALGHTVIMGSRDVEKGKAAAATLSPRMVVHQLDVTREDSIHSLYERVLTEYGKVDVLINNAGIGEGKEAARKGRAAALKKYLETHSGLARRTIRMLLSNLRRAGADVSHRQAQNTSLSNARRIMDTNFYGAWRMIQVFLPVLVKSEGGRIINVSSGMGSLDSLRGVYPGYSLSKASMNALTIMLSRELQGKGISVNAMCPGWVRTDMGGVNAPRDVAQGADTAVWLATEKEIPTGRFYKDRLEIPW